MSQPTDADPQIAPESTTKTEPIPAASTNKESSKVHLVIFLSSLGIIGCFLLPWVKVFEAGISGYNIQQLPNDYAKFVWAIPISALFVMFGVIGKTSVKALAQVAGTVPFIALLYYCTKVGTDLLQILDLGAYLTLCLGAVLVISASCLKKRES